MIIAFCVVTSICCILVIITGLALVSRYVIGEGAYQIQLENLELKKQLRASNADLEAFGNYIKNGSFDSNDSIVQELKIKKVHNGSKNSNNT